MAHDIEAPPKTAARVLLSPVSELIFVSNFVASRDPVFEKYDAEWRTEQRRQLPATARPYLDFAGEGLDWATMSLCDYVTSSDLHVDWESFAALVRGVPIEDFLFVLLNGDIPREEIERLRREPEGSASWLDRLSCFSRMSREQALRVFSDPETFREELLGFVGANRTEAFGAVWEGLRPRLENRAAMLRERLKTREPVSLAEELSRKPFSFPRDYRSFSFVPSYFVGKKQLYSYSGDKFEFVFNINTLGALSGEESKTLAGLLGVLSDRTRLDILRLLSEGPSYGKELAGRLGLTTATVSRQLDQLKTAGLVLEDKADATNVKLVRLEPTAVQTLFAQLQGFLGSER